MEVGEFFGGRGRCGAHELPTESNDSNLLTLFLAAELEFVPFPKRAFCGAKLLLRSVDIL
jgi:hypothetical protein